MYRYWAHILLQQIGLVALTYSLRILFMMSQKRRNLLGWKLRRGGLMNGGSFSREKRRCLNAFWRFRSLRVTGVEGNMNSTVLVYRNCCILNKHKRSKFDNRSSPSVLESLKFDRSYHQGAMVSNIGAEPDSGQKTGFSASRLGITTNEPARKSHCHSLKTSLHEAILAPSFAVKWRPLNCTAIGSASTARPNYRSHFCINP